MAYDTISCTSCRREHRVPAVSPEAPCCGHCRRPLPWVTRAGEDSFTAAVAVAPPVVVDVYAAWCGPCRLTGPALERLARERAGALKLVRVDAQESPALSRLLSVELLPTVMVMRYGEVVARRSGAVSAVALRRWVRQALGAPVREPAPVR